MPPPTTNDEGAVRLPRVSLDLKIPLWGLMGVGGVVAMGAASMYFQLARVADDLNDMKATMKVNNATTIQFAKEQALIEFRVMKLEQERAERR